MRKALVVYDTRFGNTKEIAFALARGIDKPGITVDCLEVNEVNMSILDDYGLVAIGGPTHMLGISKRIKEFLDKLDDVGNKGKQGFCFDTRVKSRFNRFDLNSAAKRIEKIMKKKGFCVICPRKSALVLGREGPLEEDALELFGKIGKEIQDKWLATISYL